MKTTDLRSTPLNLEKKIIKRRNTWGKNGKCTLNKFVGLNQNVSFLFFIAKVKGSPWVITLNVDSSTNAVSYVVLLMGSVTGPLGQKI